MEDQIRNNLFESKYIVKGITCSSCINIITKVLKNNIDGINEVDINPLSNELRIKSNKTINFITIKNLLNNLGYDLYENNSSILSDGNSFDKNNLAQYNKKNEVKNIKSFLNEKNNLLISIIFSIPLFIKMFFMSNHFNLNLINHYIGVHKILFLNFDIFIDIIFSFIVIFISGYTTLRKAFFSFKNFIFTMDTLIAISAISSFLTVLISPFVRISNFSMIGAMIILINNIGNFIKNRSIKKTNRLLEEISKLSVKEAHLLLEEKNHELIKDQSINKLNIYNNSLLNNINYNTIDVPLERLRPGDIVLVKPGEKIPSDGTIIYGESLIDLSIISGESEPVLKKEGDFIVGGAINKSSYLKIKINKIGEETYIENIKKLIENAQLKKVKIQLFADKITSFFVPIIFILSIFSFFINYFFYDKLATIFLNLSSKINLLKFLENTFLVEIFLKYPKIGFFEKFSLGLYSLISTLVIACPCALGLATPTAIMTGLGVAYKNKILIKNGDFFEKINKIDTIIFDKTGTIISEIPSIEKHIFLKNKKIDRSKLFYREEKIVNNLLLNEDFVLKISKEIENLSNHPISKSITSYINNLFKIKNINKKFLKFKIKIDKFEYFTGKGIKSYISIIKEDDKTKENKIIAENILILSGNYNFIKENGIIINFEKESFNKNSNFFTIDGNIFLIYLINENINEHNLKSVKIINKKNYDIYLLSGDKKERTEELANKLKINNYFYELLPEDKLKIINELQKKGKKIMMVGDGINDAPALKASDIGVAIGTGTDLALESGDIILLSGKIFDLYKAIIIGRKTFNKIKINLFWAFFYNIIMIPLAILGILNPILAEIAMALSSISVVINSLLLKRIKVEF
ncbi:MAG: cation-translocating P-type ATPase [Spirochaetes bacterium]|nr:cation-translocating P-type ATPase [Spirochaetota bacterium]